jgi:hypothetical protein
MAKKMQVEMRKKISDTLDRLKMSTDEEDKHLHRILNDKFGDMQIDEDEFVQECHRKYTLDEEDILDKYKMFISQNRVQVDNEFDDAHGNETSVHGMKIRGSYQSYNEAAERCKYVRDNIEPAIHAYAVSVGTWFPIDFEADEIQDQDYMLPALNELMGKYHEGMRAKDTHYMERKREMSEKTQNDPKSRIQERLRKSTHQRIKKDIEEFKRLQDGTDVQEAKDLKLREKQAAKNAKSLIASEESSGKKKKKKTKTKKSTVTVTEAEQSN